MDAPDGGDARAGALPNRAELRLQSLAWALASAVTALLVALLINRLSPLAAATDLSAALEAGLRAAGCGAFYGLLAFHLQRVDPDDSHLQAGLVGAVCGICSLASPMRLSEDLSLSALTRGLLDSWLPLWLPLVGSAVLLRLMRPCSRQERGHR